MLYFRGPCDVDEMSDSHRRDDELLYMFRQTRRKVKHRIPWFSHNADCGTRIARVVLCYLGGSR